MISAGLIPSCFSCDATCGRSWLVAVGMTSRSLRDISRCAGEYWHPCFFDCDKGGDLILVNPFSRAKRAYSWLTVICHAFVGNTVTCEISLDGSYDCSG